MIDTIAAVFHEFPELYTARLHLRRIQMADVAAMYDLFSDEQVTRYFGVQTFTSLEEARERIKLIRANFTHQRSLRWGIALTEDGELIGSLGYIYWKKHFHHAAVGYELAQPYWGLGLMREALTAVLNFVFERMRLHRVEALVMPANTPSLNLLQRLGFQQEGLLRDYGYWRDQFHDLFIYALLQHEWAARGT